MRTLSIRFPDDLERRLNDEAKTTGRSLSELVRQAVVEYMEERERRKFQKEIVEEARRLKGDPEIARVAEEFLPLENEAMEVAEPRTEDAPDSPEPWWK